MTISKSVAKVMFFGSLIVAALIYGAFANSLSETDMVTLAYLWVPICVTGALIWFTGNNTIIYAATMLVAMVLSLVFFFEVIFPML